MLSSNSNMFSRFAASFVRRSWPMQLNPSNQLYPNRSIAIRPTRIQFPYQVQPELNGYRKKHTDSLQLSDSIRREIATDSKMADFKAEIVRDLKERWDDLTSWVSEDVKTRWWERIKSSYSEPHRKYHNLVHLHTLFQFYDQQKDSIENRYACAFAIFFHDIVYDPKSKDNETQSADVFKHFSNETTFDESSYVIDLIEATASHCTDAHLDASATGTQDLHYFLDIDMSILAGSPEEYDEYRKQIREEYSHLDDSTYAKERTKVLQLFLQIPNIFATQVFRESYEERARSNIKREIEELQKGS